MKIEQEKCCGELLRGGEVHKTITRRQAEKIVCKLSASEKVMLNELLKALEQKR